MKKSILALAMLVTIAATAQERGGRKHMKKERMHAFKDFTPEQIAELKTKKLTLALDLTDSQQNKIHAIELEKAQDRKAKQEEMKGKTLEELKDKKSSEERYEKLSTRLDKQIEFKAEMKQILTEAQFEKWEKIHARKGHKRHAKRRAKRK